MVWAVISPSMAVSFWWASSDIRRVFMGFTVYICDRKANKAFLYIWYTRCKRFTE